MSSDNHNDNQEGVIDLVNDSHERLNDRSFKKVAPTSFHPLRYTSTKMKKQDEAREGSLSPCQSVDVINSEERHDQLDTWQKKKDMDFTSFVELYQEQIDLRIASSNNPTIVMELDLYGDVKYISQNWEDLVKTKVINIVGKPISNILLGDDEDRLVFSKAIQHMITENESYKVKFATTMHDSEELNASPSSEADRTKIFNEVSKPKDDRDEVNQENGILEPHDSRNSEHIEKSEEDVSNDKNIIELEAQGIIIQDSVTKLPSHTLWTIKPFRPITLDLELPSSLINLLGFGSEILQGYLISLQDMGITDEDSVPPPKKVVCRICEQSFPAWFIERHSEICIAEHRAREDLQLCHEAISTQRDLILKISESLWNQQQKNVESDLYSIQNSSQSTVSSSSSSSVSVTGGSILEYKSLPLPKLSPIDSSRGSIQLSRHSDEMQFILQSKKFPFGIFRRLIDLIDEALLMNPADVSPSEGAVYSPETKESIEYINTWKVFETSDLAIRELIQDTRSLVNEKLQTLSRLFSIMQYSCKILQEVDAGVLDIVSTTVRRIREESLLQEQRTTLQDASIEQHIIDDYTSENLTENELSSGRTSMLQSPRPTKLCSPIPSFFQNVNNSEEPFKSVTPKDLLLRGRQSSVSPNTLPSTAYIADSNLSNVADLSQDLNELDLSKRGAYSDYFETRRRHLSPAPYVGRPSFSTYQRNTNSRKDSSTPSESPQLTPDNYSTYKKSISEKMPRNSSGCIALSLNSPYTRSSSKAPLSPLLASQTSANKQTSSSIKDYVIIKAISKGAFGSVFLAKHRLTEDYVAIKCLKKRDMIAKNQVLNVKSERAVMMKQTDSPYVVQLFCSFQSKEYLYLVMEYLNGGDCATLLKALGTLGNGWAKRYIAEVTVCVDDIHNRGIIHRDLKPDNLLIDHHGHIKLTDFGLSKLGIAGRSRILPRKSSASEHAIEVFRKGLKQSNLSPSSVLESPKIEAMYHRRNYSESGNVTTPVEGTKAQYQGSAAISPLLTHDDSVFLNPTLHSPAVSSSTVPTIKTGRSGSSSFESPILRPIIPRTSSELSFALFDLDSPSTPHASIAANPYALYDPNSEATEEFKKFVGTPDYIAPEIIEGLGESEASDWWSIGCILFEFLYGYTPFSGDTPEQVFKNILSGSIDWPQLSEEEESEICQPEAKDLIMKLLKLNPEERLGYNGANEIKNHPYFKEIEWDSLFETEGQFVPVLNNPESTDYFDTRGAELTPFPKDDSDEENKITVLPSDSEFEFTKSLKNTQDADNRSNSIAIGMMQKRERRPSKFSDLSEFGSFYFRNLNVLERANRDVINRLKSEHLEHRNSVSSSSSESTPISKSKGHSFSGPGNSISGSAFKRPASPVMQIQTKLDKRITDNYFRHERLGSAVSNSSDDLADFSKYSPTVESAKLTPTGQRSSINSLSRHVFKSADFSPSSSDTEDVRSSALLRVQRRRDSLRRHSHSRPGSFSGSKDKSNLNQVIHVYDVLYCDPSSVVRQNISGMLERLGCLVVCVADGDELIRRATGQVKFDLIFTAVKLPKVDAVDAVKLIKYTSGINSSTPIIAITNILEDSADKNLYDDILERPFDSNVVKHCIQKHCHNDDEAIESDTEISLRQDK